MDKCEHVGTKRDPEKKCRYRARYSNGLVKVCGHHTKGHRGVFELNLGRHIGSAREVLKQAVRSYASSMTVEEFWRVVSREGLEEEAIALASDLVGTAPTERPWWRRSAKVPEVLKAPATQRVVTLPPREITPTSMPVFG